MSAPAEDEGLWVRSDVMPDGSYGVAVSVGADFARTLDRDEAIAYAIACFARATEVEHDTAVLRLLVNRLGLGPKDAGQVVANDLRPDRPDVHDATEPIRFSGMIGRARHPRPDAGEFIPLLGMQLHGKDVGQLTPADLRDHAAAVFNCLSAADLDAALHRVLIGKIGVDDERARAVIGSLAEHWPAEQPPRGT
jgi:hypothetical protein